MVRIKEFIKTFFSKRYYEDGRRKSLTKPEKQIVVKNNRDAKQALNKIRKIPLKSDPKHQVLNILDYYRSMVVHKKNIQWNINSDIERGIQENKKNKEELNLFYTNSINTELNRYLDLHPNQVNLKDGVEYFNLFNRILETKKDANIKKALNSIREDARERLLKKLIYDINDILPDPKITDPMEYHKQLNNCLIAIFERYYNELKGEYNQMERNDVTEDINEMKKKIINATAIIVHLRIYKTPQIAVTRILTENKLFTYENDRKLEQRLLKDFGVMT